MKMKMKEVKELADLVAMQPRERDAWFAERFGWIWVKCEDYKALAAPGSEYICTLDEIEELPIYDYSVHPYYSKSPNGNFALKAEMVKLGYSYEIKCSDIGVSVMFCKNSHELPDYDIVCESEIEATWKAAALALLRGE